MPAIPNNPFTQEKPYGGFISLSLFNFIFYFYFLFTFHIIFRSVQLSEVGVDVNTYAFDLQTPGYYLMNLTTFADVAGGLLTL